MKAKIILLLFLFTSAILHSQEILNNNSFSISGEISDTAENKALAYINITLLSVKDSSFIKSGITDKKGKFIFENIKSDRYLLRIISVNYKPLYRPINLNNDISLKIYLKNNDTELDEVTVTANKEIYALEPDKRVYLTANDESIQNAFAEDALENAPGVYIDTDGNIIIRGKPASVWINGRPSKRSKENLQSFLQTIPVSAIEKIEVITNPSAKYTATNTNNIVNIVLKKKISKNSLIAFGTVINTVNIFGLWSTAYITRKKFDLNVYALYATGVREYKFYDKSFSAVNTDTSFYSENSKTDYLNFTMRKIFAEFNYHLNNKTNIGLTMEYQNSNYNDSTVTFNIRRFENPETITSRLINDDYNNYLFLNLNLSHNFKKDGHTVNFNFYSFKNISEIKYNKTENYLSDNKKLTQISSPFERNDYISLQTDYSYPFNKNYNFNTGFIINPLNIVLKDKTVETSTDNNNRTEEPLLSNKYTEKKSSNEFYMTLSGKISVIKFNAGIRYEQQIYDLDQTVPVFYLYKKYPNFYPSLHLSYKTKTKHSFSLSYSRRVNTPIYNLNPYIDRTENDYIKSGNPNLNFAGTNSFEFSYFKSFKNLNVSASIYQKNTKNDIVRVSEAVYDDYFGQTVVLQTYANCADSKFSGTEISLSSSPVKNLKLRLYTNTYYQNLNGTYNNLPLTNESFIYNINFSITYKFFNIFYLKISPYYRSENSDIFHKTKSNFYTRALLKFDLFEKRLSFNIKARDIFGTKRRISEYYLDNFYHYSKEDYQFQRVQFIIIYRIGNSKYDRQAKINQLAR